MTKRKSRSAKGNSYTPVEFLRVYLGADDKLWLEEHELATDLPYDAVFALVSQGYKVSFAPDRHHNRAICSIIDKRPGSETENCCISGSGADAIDAWYAVAYRHYVLLGEDWSAVNRDGDGDTSKFG